jgi:hypothetical protein
MAKTQKQKLYDDLSALLARYPNMWVGDFIDTLDAFGRAMFRALPGPKKGRRLVKLQHRTKTYRLG